MMHHRVLGAIALAVLAAGGESAAQQSTGAPAALVVVDTLAVIVGGAADRTRRAIQLTESTFVASIRTAKLASRPLRGAGWLVPSAQLWFNSRTNRPDRDGVVWQGRGLTIAAAGGAYVSAGWLEAVVRPTVFLAENRSFLPAGATAGDHRAPIWGASIDLPYRLEDGAFARIAPGESWIRVHQSFVSAGVSTASQHWGPADLFPLLVGTEAGGFPRAFAEARDVDLKILHLDGAWSLGRLRASSQEMRGAGVRIAPTLVIAIRPHVLPSLEVGGARFFHARWNSDSDLWSLARMPFSGLLKEGNPTRESGTNEMNQLASVFARIKPAPGTEFYGEFLREDHNVNSRDLVGEPDHASAYTIGVRRGWRGPNLVRRLTLEVVNGRFSHLRQVRSQGPVYIHAPLTEGHTLRGQPIGSHAAYTGHAIAARWERLAPTRSWMIESVIERVGMDRDGHSMGSLARLRAATTTTRTSRRFGVSAGMDIPLQTPGIGIHMGLEVR